MVLLFMALFTITACGGSKEEQNSDKESEIDTVSFGQPDAESGAVLNSEVQTETQSKETVMENMQVVSSNL